MFDRRTKEYDRWFENSPLFDIELSALHNLETEFDHPGLEIGVGSGRFARELLIDYGLDPAFNPLILAGGRGIEVIHARGESLPFAPDAMAAVYILFTLCFIADPLRVLEESFRVLWPRGHLILGFIPSTGPWGQYLQRKKAEGHPFYRYASFYDGKALAKILQDLFFSVVESRATLFQPPEELTSLESSRQGIRREAGFQIIVAEKSKV